jgi:tRNA threonylcarbamoyladenosine biosynthesis protein TsaB
MRVLALDTTTGTGSVAVVEHGRVLAESAGDPSRSHAERLPGEVVQILSSLSLAPRDLDVFAVAAGPGSFTGLRIGIATMQGLSFVTNRRIVAVSALEALAHAVSADLPDGTLVGAWIDAHRHDVFSALFRVAGGPAYHPERLHEVDGATVAAPATTLEAWRTLGAPSIIAGDGAVAFAETIGGVARVTASPLLAGAIGLIAAVRAGRGEAVHPAAVRPIYVRRPDAILARETQRAQSAEKAER